MPFDAPRLVVAKKLLQRGNGHQRANRRKALAFVRDNFPGLSVLDEGTVWLKEFGTCRFSAYTCPRGAMISTPHRNDYHYGSQPWHVLDHLMMLRDMGDGRVVVCVCPIQPLFAPGMRTVGDHGMSWNSVRKVAGQGLVEVFQIS